MKLFVVATVATVAVAEKKVPPRHPLQRLNKLNKFANEWVSDNLSEKQALNWGPKFDRNTGRMEKRFELCGFYDENSEHGGPRERRQAEEETDISGPEGRYDTSNPMRGIQQITRGFSKWAERYIADCGLQPAKQVDRMAKWFGQLTGKLAENNAEEDEDNSEDNGYDNDSNNDDSNNDNSNDNDSNDEGY